MWGYSQSHQTGLVRNLKGYILKLQNMIQTLKFSVVVVSLPRSGACWRGDKRRDHALCQAWAGLVGVEEKEGRDGTVALYWMVSHRQSSIIAIFVIHICDCKVWSWKPSFP